MSLKPAPNLIGMPFIELQSVDSTNKYAMTRIQEGLASHGLAVMAHEQTAGRGQRGKKWNTEKNNLALSIVVNPYPLKPSEGFCLSTCTAVSVYDFFCKYAGDATKIKWPNDIYWNDRKAGGILIENIIKSGKQPIGNWQWAVVGIGLNINQTTFPSDLPNPVSLKQITGNHFDPVMLAKEICKILNKHFSELTHNGFKNIFDRYQQVLYKKNQKVRLKKDNLIFESTIQGISETGQLITRNRIEERFDFGEVEWLID